MKDVNCPYCDAEQDIDHDDGGYGYEQDQLHEQDCIQCDKTFVFTTFTHFTYNPKKADCLNGSEHDYQPTRTYPKAFTMMRCTMCDEERNPTVAEKDEFGIPPYPSTPFLKKTPMS